MKNSRLGDADNEYKQQKKVQGVRGGQAGREGGMRGQIIKGQEDEKREEWPTDKDETSENTKSKRRNIKE